MGPNIIQQENRMKNVPDAMLRQMLMQMTQTGQAGTPEFILAAGELQGRKEARQQAMMGQGNPKPVIADLLMGDAMPPQMPMLPENAGGVAALPAPNMEGVATMAGGGLVAFEKGGLTLSDVMRRATLDEQRAYQQTGQLPPRLQRLLTGKDTPAAAPSGPGRGTDISFDGPEVPPARLIGDQRFYPGIAPLLQRQQNPEFYAAPQDPSKAADYRAQARAADSGYYTGLAAAGQTTPGAAPAAAPTVPPAVAPTAGVAPAATPTIDYKDAFTKAGLTAQELLGAAPTVPGETTAKNVKEAVEADRKLFEELGIADPTKLRREQLEKEIAGAKTEKEQAGWLRLAEFGFNWASQNGPALQAAAKAGAAVAPGLMSDLKDLKKVEREQKKELAGLAALDAQAQRDMTLKARDRLDTQRENALRRMDERNKNIATLSASIGANAISSQTQMATTGMTTSAQRDVAGMQAEALKIERDLARKDSRAKAALEAAEQSARDIMDPTERITAIKRYFSEFYNTAYGAGAAAPAPDLAAQARAELARRGNK
jgi:hypothetical protein